MKTRRDVIRNILDNLFPILAMLSCYYIISQRLRITVRCLNELNSPLDSNYSWFVYYMETQNKITLGRKCFCLIKCSNENKLYNLQPQSPRPPAFCWSRSVLLALGSPSHSSLPQRLTDCSRQQGKWKLVHRVLNPFRAVGWFIYHCFFVKFFSLEGKINP